MARRVIEEVLDDFDGETVAAQTISFAFDGKNYEIDLNEENAATFREDMEQYIKNAREVKVEPAKRQRAAGTGRRLQAVKPAASNASPGNDAAAIRAWAAENGFQVNARGRIAASVVEAYQAAQTG